MWDLKQPLHRHPLWEPFGFLYSISLRFILSVYTLPFFALKNVSHRGRSFTVVFLMVQPAHIAHGLLLPELVKNLPSTSFLKIF